MTINTILNRFEIALWVALDDAIQYIRTTSSGPIVVVLSAVVILFGILTITASHSPNPSNPPPAAPVVGTPAAFFGNNEQENIVLGWVERLEDGARLEGLWLIVRSQQDNEVSFFPLLPSAQSAQTPDELDAGFRWSPRSQADPAFINALDSKNLLWNQYLILDRASLSGLLHLTGGAPLNGVAVMPDQLLAGLTTVTPAGEARIRQAQVLDGLCRDWERSFAAADPNLMAGLWLNTAVTDMSQTYFQQTWQEIIGNGGLNCQFPTLSPLWR